MSPANPLFFLLTKGCFGAFVATIRVLEVRKTENNICPYIKIKTGEDEI